MGIIVQKFGGTSVKSAESRKAVLGHILRAKEEGHDVVVVVSAMGRMGDPYATDTLIELLRAHGSKINPKTQDLIMSCGEIISACVMATYIEAQGIKAEAMTGFQAGILTTEAFGNADIINVDPTPILEKLKEGILKYESKITDALQRDLGKHPFESYTTEIGFTLNSIAYTTRRLKKWAKPLS